MSVQDDLAGQYEAAKELVVMLEEAWVAAGKPYIGRGGATGNAEVPHPILVMLQNARRDVFRFAKQVGPAKHAGQDPVAKVRSRIGSAPSAKLRSVK